MLPLPVAILPHVAYAQPPTGVRSLPLPASQPSGISGAMSTGCFPGELQGIWYMVNAKSSQWGLNEPSLSPLTLIVVLR